MSIKAYEATGRSEWVAGRRVAAGDILMLTAAQAEYEEARDLIKPAGGSRAAAAEKPTTRTNRRR